VQLVGFVDVAFFYVLTRALFKALLSVCMYGSFIPFSLYPAEMRPLS
jgi:hypothetical protein